MDSLRKELKEKSIGDLNFLISNFMMPSKEESRIQKRDLAGGAIFE